MSIAWYLLLRLCAPTYCKAPIHTLIYQTCKLCYFFATFHPALDNTRAMHTHDRHCTYSGFKITPSWPCADSQATIKPSWKDHLSRYNEQEIKKASSEDKHAA